MKTHPKTILLGSLLAAALSAPMISSQVGWSERVPARMSSTLVESLSACFDMRQRRIVTFDVAYSRPLRSYFLTQISNGSRTQLTKFPSTVTIDAVRMGYDALRGVVICVVNTQGRTETWEWNTTSWKRTHSTKDPFFMFSASSGARRLLWDPLRKRVVMILTGRGIEVYEYFASAWTRRALVNPLPRGPLLAAAFDARSQLVVVTWKNSGFPSSIETWRLDATTWKQLKTPGPSKRFWPAMCFDAKRRRIVLHGGDYGLPVLSDTWELDESDTWIHRMPTGSPERNLHVLVFDGNACVAIGGTRRLNQRLSTHADDVQAYAPLRPAASESYGQHCGSNVILRTQQLPWIGSDARFEITGSASSGLIVTGTSKSRWNSITLPLDLSGAGMPGCSLWASANRIDGVSASSFGYRIPAQQSLIGVRYFHQVARLQPSANAAGLAWSNALDLRIGER